jgi:hypothetical protein
MNKPSKPPTADPDPVIAVEPDPNAEPVDQARLDEALADLVLKMVEQQGEDGGDPK